MLLDEPVAEEIPEALQQHIQLLRHSQCRGTLNRRLRIKESGKNAAERKQQRKLCFIPLEQINNHNSPAQETPHARQCKRSALEREAKRCIRESASSDRSIGDLEGRSSSSCSRGRFETQVLELFEARRVRRPELDGMSCQVKAGGCSAS